jgi:hypothetical protein
MKVVLALSTALLAISAANGEPGMDKPESTTYRYNVGSLSVQFGTFVRLSDCLAEGIDVNADTRISRTGAERGESNSGSLTIRVFDSCNGNRKVTTVRASLGPELVLEGGPRQGAVLTAEGEASVEECIFYPRRRVCIDIDPEPFNLKATLTSTETPRPTIANSNIIYPSGARFHSQTRSLASSVDNVDLSGSVLPLLSSLEFDSSSTFGSIQDVKEGRIDVIVEGI